MKKRIWMGLCLILCMGSGCGEASRAYFEECETSVSRLPAASRETEEISVTETAEDCYVHVCGAVHHPGVYRLPAGSRVYEAVLLAGGLLDTACEDGINQAQEVADGQMIKVLTVEEAKEQENAQTGEPETDGKINLNTADAAALMTLPGIGEAKAASILSYREEHGGFSSAEEIKNITGIKEGVYSKIKDRITAK
ncbi:ComE operon protein 1 [Lachnospiraceae bacterium]|nr:ComE operon protein 1 [Lachnospiraceae bacterium]